MSSCGEGEAPVMYRQTRRIAKKPHVCCECASEITTGERYEYTAGLWETGFHQFKTCESCVEVREDVHELAGFYPAFGSAGCCYTEALKEYAR